MSVAFYKLLPLYCRAFTFSLSRCIFWKAVLSIIQIKIIVHDFKTSPMWNSQFPNGSDRFRFITFLQIYKDRMLPTEVAA